MEKISKLEQQFLDERNLAMLDSNVLSRGNDSGTGGGSEVVVSCINRLSGLKENINSVNPAPLRVVAVNEPVAAEPASATADIVLPYFRDIPLQENPSIELLLAGRREVLSIPSDLENFSSFVGGLVHTPSNFDTLARANIVQDRSVDYVSIIKSFEKIRLKFSQNAEKVSGDQLSRIKESISPNCATDGAYSVLDPSEYGMYEFFRMFPQDVLSSILDMIGSCSTTEHRMFFIIGFIITFGPGLKLFANKKFWCEKPLSFLLKIEKIIKHVSDKLKHPGIKTACISAKIQINKEVKIAEEKIGSACESAKKSIGKRWKDLSSAQKYFAGSALAALGAGLTYLASNPSVVSSIFNGVKKIKFGSGPQIATEFVPKSSDGLTLVGGIANDFALAFARAWSRVKASL